MKKKEFDRPQKVRNTLEELEVLSALKDSVQWAIAKRIAQRYINNIKTISFKLPEDDNLKVRHAGLYGQVLGVKQFIRMIDDSGKNLEQEEKNE